MTSVRIAEGVPLLEGHGRLPSRRPLDHRWDRSRGIIFNDTKRPIGSCQTWNPSAGLVFADTPAARRWYPSRAFVEDQRQRPEQGPRAIPYNNALRKPSFKDAHADKTEEQAKKIEAFQKSNAELRDTVKMLERQIGSMEKAHAESVLPQPEREKERLAGREAAERELRVVIENLESREDASKDKNNALSVKNAHLNSKLSEATAELQKARQDLRGDIARAVEGREAALLESKRKNSLLLEQMSRGYEEKSRDHEQQIRDLQRKLDHQQETLDGRKGQRALERTDYRGYSAAFTASRLAVLDLLKQLRASRDNIGLASKAWQESSTKLKNSQELRLLRIAKPALFNRIDSFVTSRINSLRSEHQLVLEAGNLVNRELDKYALATHESRHLTRRLKYTPGNSTFHDVTAILRTMIELPLRKQLYDVTLGDPRETGDQALWSPEQRRAYRLVTVVASLCKSAAFEALLGSSAAEKAEIVELHSSRKEMDALSADRAIATRARKATTPPGGLRQSLSEREVEKKVTYQQAMRQHDLYAAAVRKRLMLSQHWGELSEARKQEDDDQLRVWMMDATSTARENMALLTSINAMQRSRVKTRRQRMASDRGSVTVRPSTTADVGFYAPIEDQMEVVIQSKKHFSADALDRNDTISSAPVSLAYSTKTAASLQDLCAQAEAEIAKHVTEVAGLEARKSREQLVEPLDAEQLNEIDASINGLRLRDAKLEAFLKDPANEPYPMTRERRRRQAKPSDGDKSSLTGRLNNGVMPREGVRDEHAQLPRSTSPISHVEETSNASSHGSAARHMPFGGAHAAPHARAGDLRSVRHMHSDARLAVQNLGIEEVNSMSDLACFAPHRNPPTTIMKTLQMSAPQTSHASGEHEDSHDATRESVTDESQFSQQSTRPNIRTSTSDATSSGTHGSVTEQGFPDPDPDSSDRSYESDSSMSETSAQQDSLADEEPEQVMKYNISGEDLGTAQSDGRRFPMPDSAFWSYKLYKNAEGLSPKVYYCTTFEQSEERAKLFQDEQVLGFDIEWEIGKYPPTSLKKHVSLIQIACEDKIALFQLGTFTGETVATLMPPALKGILEDPLIIKTGVNIGGDNTRMRKHLQVDMLGVMELSHLHKLVMHGQDEPHLVNFRLVSMSEQVQKHLLLPLKKDGVRTSRWSQRLDGQQTTYAASDAYAGFRLFYHLDNLRKRMTAVPPRPPYLELKQPIVLGNGTEVHRSRSYARPPVTSECEEASIDDDEGEEYFDAPEYPDALNDDRSLEPEILIAPPIAETSSTKLTDTTRLLRDLAITQSNSQEQTKAVQTPQETTVARMALAARTLPAVRTPPAANNLSSTTDVGAVTPGQVLSPRPEFQAAETWAQTWRSEHASSTTTGYKSVSNSTGLASLRAYHIWHYQGCDLERVATVCREPPLALSTVASYVLDAVRSDKLPFEAERLREALRVLPRTAYPRYRGLIEKLGGEI